MHEVRLKAMVTLEGSSFWCISKQLFQNDFTSFALTNYTAGVASQNLHANKTGITNEIASLLHSQEYISFLVIHSWICLGLFFIFIITIRTILCT